MTREARRSAQSARVREPSRRGKDARPRAAAPRAKPAGGPLTKMAAKLNERVTRQATAKAGKSAPASRRNKKGLVLYVDPAVTVALRRLALDRGASVQALGMAALNLLFVANGVPPFPTEEETT